MAAAVKVLAEINGVYAFAALSLNHPDLLIVARNASPLALGIGDGACYIGSDAIALSHLTRRVIYLRDQDFALVHSDGPQIFAADGTPANRESVIVSVNPGLVDKGGYRHFMEKKFTSNLMQLPIRWRR